MTIQDLINDFRLLYDFGSLALPGVEDSEIRRLLDIEQYKVINQKIGGNNVYGTGFPDNFKRIEDLRFLLKKFQSDGAQETESSLYYVILPSDLIHIYEVNVLLSYSGGNFLDTASPIDKSFQKRVNNSFRNKDPYTTNSKYFISKTASGDNILKIAVPKDTSIILGNTFKVTYVKKPYVLTSGAASVVVTDFQDDVYREIVRSAVDTLIAIVSPEKSQISQQQLKRTE